MHHRLLLRHIVCIVISVLGLLCTSCKKEASKQVVWASSAFAGNYGGSEYCSFNAASPGNITISAINDSTVSIADLYTSGRSVTGYISHDSCVIHPQISDTVILQGLIILKTDTLNLTIIASGFGQQNKCTAVLLRH